MRQRRQHHAALMASHAIEVDPLQVCSSAEQPLEIVACHASKRVQVQSRDHCVVLSAQAATGGAQTHAITLAQKDKYLVLDWDWQALYAACSRHDANDANDVSTLCVWSGGVRSDGGNRWFAC
jgi:hypothetical protein